MSSKLVMYKRLKAVQEVFYHARVLTLERDGLCTSDAEAVADAEEAKAAGLASHILAMADDAYFTGHPEWAEIVSEAQRIKGL